MYPTAHQVDALNEVCAHARKAWNLGVEQHRVALKYRPYRLGKRQTWPTASEREAQLTEAREFDEWLGSGPRVVQAQALRDLDRAFQAHFDRPHTVGWPKFRKKRSSNGFAFTDLNRPGQNPKIRQLNHRWAAINVPKTGWVKFKLSRPWNTIADAKSARVTLDRAGRWHVSFPVKLASTERTPTGRSTGVDRGVSNSIALASGLMSHAPTLTAGERNHLLRQERLLPACGRDDPQREVHRQAIGRCYARLTDRRNDWIEKTTTELIQQFDMIAVEKLNVTGMVKAPNPRYDEHGKPLPNGARAKAGLNRAILAQCWGRWLDRLKTKAERANVIVVEVNAAYTSQRCHTCGHTTFENRDSQAVFVCVNCGHEAHADTNAARNILQRGEELMARTGPQPLENAHASTRNPRPSGCSRNHSDQQLDAGCDVTFL